MPPKYKPGGKRFPPRETPKLLPKQVTKDSDLSPAEVTTSVGLEQEAENQFELELCWCIQQLQLSLDSGKLGQKQSLDGLKTLNLLKSDNVALIRKRQAMRNTFGDYRAKMIQDEKTHGKYVSKFKFAAPKLANDKSMFLKKATQERNEKEFSNGDEKEKSERKKTFIMKKESSDVPFTFNFIEPPSN